MNAAALDFTFWVFAFGYWMSYWKWLQLPSQTSANRYCLGTMGYCLIGIIMGGYIEQHHELASFPFLN